MSGEEYGKCRLLYMECEMRQPVCWDQRWIFMGLWMFSICSPLLFLLSASFYLGLCLHAKLLQVCLTLCNPMDCSSPDSSVHGILQTRIPEWVAMPSSRGSSPPNPPLLGLLHWLASSFLPALLVPGHLIHSTVTVGAVAGPGRN